MINLIYKLNYLQSFYFKAKRPSHVFVYSCITSRKYTQNTPNQDNNVSDLLPKIYTGKYTVNRNISAIKSVNNNHAGMGRYYPPAIKEWCNSVYSFNKNTVKTLLSNDKIVYKLIKSYFNSYSLKLGDQTRFKRLRIRNRKASINRLLVSEPDLKHTSDKVNVTVYTYDKRKSYYLNKIGRNATIDNIVKIQGKSIYSSFINNLKQKSLLLRSKITKTIKTLLKEIKSNEHASIVNKFSNIYLKNYVYRYMRKEIISVRYRQSMLFEQSKHEKQLLLQLTNLVEKIYNKKVIFNIVNLKYFYNNSNIFSEALVTKIKNRKNKPAKVLKSSLNTFYLPPVNKLAVYGDIYRKKKVIQNLSVNELSLQLHKLPKHQSEDVLDTSLIKLYSFSNDDSVINMNQIMESIRHKFTNGIRIIVAGRLTKRNTADRSMSKLRYKGSIKNTDSSFKGLSAVLLRGHAKSNVAYNQSRSKIRIGSFGVKTWMSSD